MHPSKLPEEIFRGLRSEALQEATINGRRWLIAPDRTGSGFIGVRGDTDSTSIAVWPDFPKDGERPTLEIITSTANLPGWAPVDSKMNTGFAKEKYRVHWLAYMALVHAGHAASIGREF